MTPATSPVASGAGSLADRAILSIAGSDPSGGAGLQADLKTFTALGVYGAAAITCITVQNTLGVRYFTPLAPQLVHDQIRAVLEDLPVSHVKIGMLGTPEIALAVAAALADFAGEVIYDPVLVAGAGQSLCRGGAGGEIPVLQEKLLATVSVLTPNLPELAALAGRETADLAPVADAPPTAIVAAVRELFQRYPRLRAVALTGAHHQPASALIRDFLLQRPPLEAEPGSASGSLGEQDLTEIRHVRRQSNNLHGTGCTFAAALAVHHQLTGSYPEALQRTVAFLDRVIAAGRPLQLGKGNGPLGHHLYHPPAT